MIFWRIYFFLMSLIYLIFLLPRLTHPTLSGWLDVLVNTITMLALFGLAFDKIIGFKEFWRVGFVFCVGVELFNLVKNIMGSGENFPLIPFLAVWAVLIVPIYIATFLYAFKSEDIWQAVD